MKAKKSPIAVTVEWVKRKPRAWKFRLANFYNRMLTVSNLPEIKFAKFVALILLVVTILVIFITELPFVYSG
jgi:hypothetical protein